MTAPIEIARTDLAARPWLAWNAFVEIAHRAEAGLNEVQRRAHRAFRYEGEVQNGGHLQFFLNVPGTALDGIEEALDAIGAPEHAGILREAAARWRSQERRAVEDPEAYVAEAARGEFEAADDAFHGSSPSLTTKLEAFFERHRDAFVRVTG